MPALARAFALPPTDSPGPSAQARSYQQDPSYLADLCRQTLVFETVGELAACLETVVADQVGPPGPADRRRRGDDGGEGGFGGDGGSGGDGGYGGAGATAASSDRIALDRIGRRDGCEQGRGAAGMGGNPCAQTARPRRASCVRALGAPARRGWMGRKGWLRRCARPQNLSC